MSYTTLYVAREDGVMEDAGDFDAGSSFVTGFWMALVRQYLGRDEFPSNPPDWQSQMQPLFDLVTSEQVPLAYRIVLATMFDRALLQPEDLLLVGFSLSEVKEWYRPIPEVAYALAKMESVLYSLRQRSEVRAVGFRWTSVAEDLWTIREQGEDEGHPYNVLTDTGHQWLREIL